MEIDLQLHSYLVGIHFCVLNYFKIPYEVSIRTLPGVGEIITFVIADTCPPRLIFDFGTSVGLLMQDLERVWQEVQWPITTL